MIDYGRVAVIKGALWGSGYLIGPGLVLTAKHVVGNTAPNVGAQKVQLRLLRDYLKSTQDLRAQMRPAEVLWPPPDSADADLDVALLLTDDPAESSDLPISWAELTKFGNQDLIAIGFPDSVNLPNTREDVKTKDRDTREIHGTIRGGDRLRARGRNAHTVDFQVEPMWEKSHYDWQGISGAAVFANSDLVGVVAKAEQMLPATTHILKMHPIDRLFDNEGFRVAISEYATRLPKRRSSPWSGADQVHWFDLIRGGGLTPAHPIFVGRKEALRELLAWLKRDTSGGKACAVVGGPGTGKSTLLARLVALSDPTFRDSIIAESHQGGVGREVVPDKGFVNVAIYGGAKTLRDVSLQIASATNCTRALSSLEVADQPEEVRRGVAVLVNELSGRCARLVILLDALDESREPSEIARHLIQKLSRLDFVWIVVSSQPDTVDASNQRLRSLGTAAVEIDLENEKYMNANDMSDYVEQMLLSSSSVEWRATATSPIKLRQITQAISSRAGNVYMIANLLASSCIDGLIPIGADGEIPIDQLPSNLEGAFDIYLKRFDAIGEGGIELNKRRAVDLMTPLAYAEGYGLPWDNLWAALASNLSGREYTDSDIRLFLEHAGPLVARIYHANSHLFRLYHGLLARHLRKSGFQEEAHKRFVATLTASVPLLPTGVRDWSKAHGYIRRYIVLHAARVGSLEPLLTQPSFLAAIDADMLLSVLWRLKLSSKVARDAAAVYRLASHRLRISDIGARAAQLELYALQNGYKNLAFALRALPYSQPWRTEWCDCRASIPHIVLGSHDKYIRALSIASDAGQDLVISGDDGGTVRLWHLTSGELLLQLEHDCFGITSLAAVDSPSGLRVIAGDNEGRLTCWDVRGRSQTWRNEGTHSYIKAVAVAKINLRTLIFASSKDLISIHDLETGEPLVWRLNEFTEGENILWFWEHRKNVAWQGATALIILTYDDKLLMVAGDRGGKIRVVDLCSPDNPHIFQAHSSEIYSLRAVESDQRTYIASASTEVAMLWDISDLSKPVSEIHTFNPISDGSATIVWFDVAQYNRQTLIVLGRERDLRVCDKWGRDVATIPEAHNGSIGPVASGKVGNDPVFVSAGDDYSIRVWDLQEVLQLAVAREGPQDTVVAVVSARIGEVDCAIFGHESGLITTIDLEKRRLLPWTHTIGRQGIRRLSVIDWESQALVVIADMSSLEVWNPKEDTSTRLAFAEGESLTSACAAVMDDEPLVAVGTSEGEICVFGIANPQQTSCRFLAHVHRSHNLADEKSHRSNVGTILIFELNGEARLLSSGWEDHAIGVWALNGQPQHSSLLPPYWPSPVVVTAVDRAVGTRFLAIGDMQGRCTVWDLNVPGPSEPIKIESGDAGQADKTRLTQDANWVRVIQFVKIGRRHTICVGYRDGTVGIYDPISGVPLVCAHTGSLVFMNGLAADSKGRIVVAGRLGLSVLKLDTF